MECLGLGDHGAVEDRSASLKDSENYLEKLKDHQKFFVH